MKIFPLINEAIDCGEPTVEFNQYYVKVNNDTKFKSEVKFYCKSSYSWSDYSSYKMKRCLQDKKWSEIESGLFVNLWSPIRPGCGMMF